MADNATAISVIDFRRHSMVLHWHADVGTWTPCENPPALVHGIALIRSAQPNICVYGQNGRLRLQIGADQYVLSESSPHITCSRGFASFGFRRRFSVRSSSGAILFSLGYWTAQRRDFFRWFAARAEDPDWRATSARTWSEGLAASVLRSR